MTETSLLRRGKVASMEQISSKMKEVDQKSSCRITESLVPEVDLITLVLLRTCRQNKVLCNVLLEGAVRIENNSLS